MTTPNVSPIVHAGASPHAPMATFAQRERAANLAYAHLLDIGTELTWRLHWDTGKVHGPRAEWVYTSTAQGAWLVGTQPHSHYPNDIDALLIYRPPFAAQERPTAPRVGSAYLWPLRGVYRAADGRRAEVVA